MKTSVQRQVGLVVFLSIGSMAVVSTAGPLRRNPSPNKSCDEQVLRQALRSIGEKDYEGARVELERLARPKCSLASAAILLIADSHYCGGLSLDLAHAEEGYYRWVEMFPDDELAPVVLRKIAELHLRQLISRDGSRHLVLANRVLQRISDSQLESEDNAIRPEWIAITEELLADHELKIAKFYLDIRDAPVAAKARCQVAVQKYPRFTHIDNVLWYLGQADENLAQTEEWETNINEAVVSYKKIVSEHGDSEFRERAVERLKNFGIDIPDTDPEITKAFRERSSKLTALQSDFEALKQTTRRGVILDDNDRPNDVILKRVLRTAGIDGGSARQK